MQGRKLLITIGAIVAVLGLVAAYLFFGNNSNKQEQYLYIPTGANYDTVTAILHREHVLNNNWSFEQLAKIAGYPKKNKTWAIQNNAGYEFLPDSTYATLGQPIAC